MSQIMTRKSAVTEEKEKRTDSPVKDMKKKVAANAEKEKQTVEKPAEKQADKVEKPKQADKPAEKQKQPEKPTEKQKQPEKPAEKQKQAEKQAEKTQKQAEKPADKNDKAKQPEKAADKNKAGDTSAEKADKKAENKVTEKKDGPEKKDDKTEKNGKSDAKKNGEKSKQNGSKQNGDANGVEDQSDDDVLEIPDDDEFPELAYDDSDNEAPSPDGLRSATRRSQVKATRTPETPQPAAEKPAESATADSQPKDKVLKLSEAPPTDRKLRSDDPKEKKQEKKEENKEGEASKMENGQKEKDGDVIEINDDEEPRKTDTNYSKSRVKVSPYRRSTRIHDQTTSSVTANYTGNNTTMEMDITAETSSFAEDVSLDDSSYLNGLRSIRGRRSYKPLKELAIKHNRSLRSNANVSVSDSAIRPTGTVVGRKRKPEDINDSIEVAIEAGTELTTAAHTKRMRLLDRIAQPFRRTLASTPLPNRRNPEIVGINTDLPLSAPVSSPSTFDPETLKVPPAVTVTPPTPDEMDKKRCVVM